MLATATPITAFLADLSRRDTEDQIELVLNKVIETEAPICSIAAGLSLKLFGITGVGENITAAALQWLELAKSTYSQGVLCKHCNVSMIAGQAMQQTFRAGMPDFPGDNDIVTMSAGGTGKLVSCLKCPKCGHSIQSYMEGRNTP